MSYTLKHLDITFKLGSSEVEENPSFDGGANNLSISGLRASIRCEAPQSDLGEAKIEVYGLSESNMNLLMAIREGVNPFLRKANEITVEAYEDGGEKTVVFKGNIYTALVDFNAAPDVSLTISAYENLMLRETPINPVSFQGAVPVAKIMAFLAGKVSAKLQNYGVDDSYVLRDQYLDGNAIDMIAEVAKAANIQYSLEGDIADTSPEPRILAIFPIGTTREHPKPIELNETNIIGYPIITPQGVTVRTPYSPEYRNGAEINISNSSVKYANGDYKIMKVNHALDSETPNGLWETQLSLCYFDKKSESVETNAEYAGERP